MRQDMWWHSARPRWRAKATGRLVWLGVEEGSRVKKDEVIARLEDLDVRATQEQTAASVKVAKANLEQGMAELRDAEIAVKRSQDLLKQGFVSQSANDIALSRLDKAKASISSLEAAIAAAQAALRGANVAVDQTLIRAPFDGVVLTKSANIGDVITPFSSALDSKGAVVSIADMSTLEVEADVSESSFFKVTCWPAGRNPAGRVAGPALPGRRRAHGTHRRPFESHGDDQDPISSNPMPACCRR